MASFATIQHTNAVPAQAKEAENTLRKQEEQKINDQSTTGFFGGLASPGFSIPRTGADFSGIPTRPSLQTGLSVQCCSKGGGSCSCPKCKKAEQENDDNDEVKAANKIESATPVNVSQAPVDSSPVQIQEAGPDMGTTAQPVNEQTTPASPENETAAPASPATALIVADSVEVTEGQMTKTAFLQQLRAQITSTIEPVLATAGQTTENCPYLNYWLDLYQQKNAEEVEATVRRYAPDSANAQNAGDYISIVTQRALRAAEIWARTGRLSGVPEGVPTTLPTQNTAQPNNEGSNRTVVMRKSRAGASRQSSEPATIQKQLGEGQPLTENVRSRMESVFGTSFSNVRTHTDANAASISNRVNARAFTVGNHVAFDSGEYKPGTMLGDALIAHELAHVVQQQGASEAVDKMERGTENYDSLERDADQAAVGAVSSLWGGLKNGTSKMLQNSVPLLRSGLRLQRCNNSTPATGCTPTFNSLNAVATGNVVMTTAWPGASCEMALGEPSSPGMTLRSEVTVPDGCTGTLEYLQLINRCLQRRPTGGANERARTGSYVLDTSDPYESQRVTSAGTVNFETTDSPGGGFTDGMEHLKVADRFKMWLLWTPDTPAGASRIALGMVEWNWGGESAKTGAGAGCASDWTISNATRNGGTGSATSTMPTWTQTYPADFPAYSAGTC
jgi:hypothetical protein